MPTLARRRSALSRRRQRAQVSSLASSKTAPSSPITSTACPSSSATISTCTPPSSSPRCWPRQSASTPIPPRQEVPLRIRHPRPRLLVRPAARGLHPRRRARLHPERPELGHPQAHPRGPGLPRCPARPDPAALRARRRDIAKVYYDPTMTIFVTSPGRITPYHMDGETNFLAQIHGTKLVYIYNGDDPQVLSPQQMEQYWTGALPRIEVPAGLPEGNWQYTLAPGNGVFNPAIFPHWLQNGPDVSASPCPSTSSAATTPPSAPTGPTATFARPALLPPLLARVSLWTAPRRRLLADFTRPLPPRAMF